MTNTQNAGRSGPAGTWRPETADGALQSASSRLAEPRTPKMAPMASAAMLTIWYRPRGRAPATAFVNGLPPRSTGSASEREGALYVAQDQGYFRKYGLDVTLVQVRNGPVGMAALSSGESLLHWGSVSGANLGAISEGADLVFVAGFINRLTGAFAANPRIKTPAELRGHSVGVNSLSGGTWIFTMLTLDHWGLSPARDKIQMRALGDNSVVSQALLAGNVDAAYLSYTYAKIVQNKGFRVLADLEKLPIAFQGTGIITRRSTIASSAGTVEAVISLMPAPDVLSRRGVSEHHRRGRTAPFFTPSSARIAPSSTTSSGVGEGTTRRQPRPETPSAI